MTPPSITGQITGMSRKTGKALSGLDHIIQSISDILTTPKGSRVMRHSYGSDLYRLIDAPINAATRQLLIAAIAIAIARWEPRIRLTKVSTSGASASGALTLTLTAIRLDLPKAETVTLSLSI